ncbi:hypothetical protein DQ238_22350 [Geodermatophilus sp. TF02-6]|nr:hypothetical protein DQ238_22350 [Geodermatophilus sp. TF02-6]
MTTLGQRCDHSTVDNDGSVSPGQDADQVPPRPRPMAGRAVTELAAPRRRTTPAATRPTSASEEDT